MDNDIRKEKLSSATKTGISQLLEYLQSSIDFPLTKEGEVREDKLLAIVQAREVSYNAVCAMIDSLELAPTDNHYKHEIIKGLDITFWELTSIIERGVYSSTDDMMNSIAKSKSIASVVCKNILVRIELMQDAEGVNKRRVDNKKPTSIAERFANGK